MEKKTALESNIEKVLQELEKEGYCQSTILLYKRAYNGLLKDAALMQVDTLSDALADYFVKDSASRKTGQYCHLRKHLHSSCIRKLRGYEEKGYIGWKPRMDRKIDRPLTVGFQNIHSQFLEQLKIEGKSENTVESCRNVSCKFLIFIEGQGYTCLKTVPPELIHDFFHELRATWNSASLRTAATRLRSFLRFAEYGDRLITEIPAKLPKKTTIIPVLTQEEEQAIWGVLKTDAVSSRDKAIMILALITGLREVDIVNLKLSDIDWKCNVISISQRKTNKPLILPLLPAIGNAIARYIVNDRPKTDSPYVFLSCNAPHRPLKGRGGCYHVVKKIFLRAGIRLGNELKGTRLMRHHMASKMLKKGVAVQTISLTLGHVNPDSADIYLTTDEKKLRDCALTLSAIPMKVGGLQ